MKNLIKDLFNIDEGQIEKFNSHNQEQNIIIHVKLKKEASQYSVRYAEISLAATAQKKSRSTTGY